MIKTSGSLIKSFVRYSAEYDSGIHLWYVWLSRVCFKLTAIYFWLWFFVTIYFYILVDLLCFVWFPLLLLYVVQHHVENIFKRKASPTSEIATMVGPLYTEFCLTKILQKDFRLNSTFKQMKIYYSQNMNT